MAGQRARRTRIDSAAAAVATLAASARKVAPPKYIKLPKSVVPFWDAVIDERAASEWSEADLIVAASLARAMAEMEAFSFLGGGNAKELALVDKIARRIVTLRRALGIDSRAKHGEQRDVNKRRAIAKGIEEGHNPMADDGDDLLARPATLQ